MCAAKYTEGEHQRLMLEQEQAHETQLTALRQRYATLLDHCRDQEAVVATSQALQDKLRDVSQEEVDALNQAMEKLKVQFLDEQAEHNLLKEQVTRLSKTKQSRTSSAASFASGGAAPSPPPSSPPSTPPQDVRRPTNARTRDWSFLNGISTRKVWSVMEEYQYPHPSQLKADKLSAWFTPADTVRECVALGGNRITDVGVRDLCGALQGNTSLTYLDLAENQIADEGVRDLCGVLHGNTTLTTLFLGGNRITDVGVRDLCGALQGNTSLTTLKLFSDLSSGSDLESRQSPPCGASALTLSVSLWLCGLTLAKDIKARYSSADCKMVFGVHLSKCQSGPLAKLPGGGSGKTSKQLKKMKKEDKKLEKENAKLKKETKSKSPSASHSHSSSKATATLPPVVQTPEEQERSAVKRMHKFVGHYNTQHKKLHKALHKHDPPRA